MLLRRIRVVDLFVVNRLVSIPAVPTPQFPGDVYSGHIEVFRNRLLK